MNAEQDWHYQGQSYFLLVQSAHAPIQLHLEVLNVAILVVFPGRGMPVGVVCAGNGKSDVAP